MNNRAIGNIGEDLAATCLLVKGYKIICRNWNCHWGELDIVATKNSKLIFVEVKYRRNNNYGEAFESLTYYKRQHLYRAIQIYLKQSYEDVDWQFDLLCIDGRALTHYKNVSLTSRVL